MLAHHDTDNEPTASAQPADSAITEAGNVATATVTPTGNSDPISNVKVRRRGVRVFALLVGVSLISAGIGWAVARNIKSPADVAARTAAPTASRIVAPVEERELRSTLFTRGTIRFGSPKAVALPVSALKTGSMIVTSPPVKGTAINEGDRVGDVSGRSVMVLQGAQPMYRDIKPGDTGNDIVQLKAALSRLGYPAGTGVTYDTIAEKAMSDWLASKGIDPYGASDAQRDRLKGLRDGLQKAQEAVATAKLSLTKGNVVVTTDKILAADEQVRAAKEKIAQLTTDSPRTSSELELGRERKRLAVETAKTTLANAESALDRARKDTSGELSIADAQLAVTTANQKVVETADQITKATTAVTDAKFAMDDAKFAVDDAQAALTDAQGSLKLSQDELQRQKDKAPPEVTASAEGFTVDEDAKAQTVRAAQDAVVQARASVRNANAALRLAQRDLANAQTGTTVTGAAPTPADIAVLTAAVRDAEAAVADAQATLKNAEDELARQLGKPAPRVPTNSVTKTADPAAKDAAVRGAESTVTTAQAGVRSAQTALRTAQRQLQKAETAAGDAQRALDLLKPNLDVVKEQARIAGLRLAQVQADSGSGTDTGGATATGATVGGATGGSSTGTATGGGSAGGGSGKRTLVQLQQDIDQAKANLTLAEREYKDALKNNSTVEANKAALSAAKAQLKIANAQRAELSKPTDLATLKQAVDSAERSQANAQRDLDEYKATIGVYVPANEVLFFAELPLRVDESKLVAGDVVTGAFMTVASPKLAIDSSVDTSDSGSLRVGMPAEIELSDFNLTVPATVAEIGKQPGTNGVDASRVYVSLTPKESEIRSTDTGAAVGGASGTDASAAAPAGPTNGAPSLRDLNGTSVKVTIPISSTGGKVLAVPTAAISAAADGSTRVEVEDQQGKPTRFVSVKAGLRAEGYVQVTPTQTGALKPGDQVVTGKPNGEQLQGSIDANDKPGKATPGSEAVNSDGSTTASSGSEAPATNPPSGSSSS
jgi:multidrug efflux pump subunit AcrA (membrane-fusion protein)